MIWSLLSGVIFLLNLIKVMQYIGRFVLGLNSSYKKTAILAVS